MRISPGVNTNSARSSSTIVTTALAGLNCTAARPPLKARVNCSSPSSWVSVNRVTSTHSWRLVSLKVSATSMSAA